MTSASIPLYFMAFINGLLVIASIATDDYIYACVCTFSAIIFCLVAYYDKEDDDA